MDLSITHYKKYTASNDQPDRNHLHLIGLTIHKSNENFIKILFLVSVLLQIINWNPDNELHFYYY